MTGVEETEKKKCLAARNSLQGHHHNPFFCLPGPETDSVNIDQREEDVMVEMRRANYSAFSIYIHHEVG